MKHLKATLTKSMSDTEDEAIVVLFKRIQLVLHEIINDFNFNNVCNFIQKIPINVTKHIIIFLLNNPDKNIGNCLTTITYSEEKINFWINIINANNDPGMNQINYDADHGDWKKLMALSCVDNIEKLMSMISEFDDYDYYRDERFIFIYHYFNQYHICFEVCYQIFKNMSEMTQKQIVDFFEKIWETIILDRDTNVCAMEASLFLDTEFTKNIVKISKLTSETLPQHFSNIVESNRKRNH